MTDDPRRLAVRAATPSLEWLLAGGVYDHTDELTADQFDRSAHDAHLIAIDPGRPAGVACFSHDLPVYGITLFQVSPEQLSKTLMRFPIGLDLDIVCETPLKGHVRVFDESPWKVRGFVEHWHAAVTSHGELFVPAPVGWLKAGEALMPVPPVRSHADHPRDAMRYGVAALALNTELRRRLEDAT